MNDEKNVSRTNIININIFNFLGNSSNITKSEKNDSAPTEPSLFKKLLEKLLKI